MQDTKAIRPEIKGLFETIKVQAFRYAEAFEELENVKVQYEDISRKLRLSYNDLSNSINNEIFHLKEKYDDLIKFIKIEQTKVTQKYSELSDLKQLQDSYFSTLETLKNIHSTIESQSQKLDQYYKDYTENIDSIKNRADSKVDEYLKDSFSKIENIVKSFQSKFEEKINNKIKQIDSKVVNNDYLYNSFQEKYIVEFNKIINEIDNFKRSIVGLEVARNNPNDPNSMKSIITDLNDKFIKIEEENKKLNERIDTFYKNFKQFNQQPNFIEQPVSKQKLNESNVNEIALINKLTNQLNEIEKKYSLMLGITISAIILSVISFVLSIFF